MSSLNVMIKNCVELEKHYACGDLWRYHLDDQELKLHSLGMRVLLWFKESLLAFRYPQMQRKTDLYRGFQKRNIKILTGDVSLQEAWDPSWKELQIARVSLKRFRVSQTALKPLIDYAVKKGGEKKEITAFFQNQDFDRLNPIQIETTLQTLKKAHHVFSTAQRQHELFPSYAKKAIPTEMWVDLGCEDFWKQVKQCVKNSLKLPQEHDAKAVVNEIFRVVPQLSKILLADYSGNSLNRINAQKFLHDSAKEHLKDEDLIDLNHKIHLILAEKLRPNFVKTFGWSEPAVLFRDIHLKKAQEFVTQYFPTSHKQNELALLLLGQEKMGTITLPDEVKKTFEPIEEVAAMRYAKERRELLSYFKDSTRTPEHYREQDILDAVKRAFDHFPELLDRGQKEFFVQLVKEALFGSVSCDKEKVDTLIDEALVDVMHQKVSKPGVDRMGIPKFNGSTLAKMAVQIDKTFPKITDPLKKMELFYKVLFGEFRQEWIQEDDKKIERDLLTDSDLMSHILNALFHNRLRKWEEATKEKFSGTSFDENEKKQLSTFIEKVLKDFPEFTLAFEHTKNPRHIKETLHSVISHLFLETPSALEEEIKETINAALILHTHRQFKQQVTAPHLVNDNPDYSLIQLRETLHLASLYFPEEPHNYVFSIMIGRKSDNSDKTFILPNTIVFEDPNKKEIEVKGHTGTDEKPTYYELKVSPMTKDRFDALFK